MDNKSQSKRQQSVGMAGRRFNYKPLPKRDFRLWTLEQPKFELNFSHPERLTFPGKHMQRVRQQTMPVFTQLDQ